MPIDINFPYITSSDGTQFQSLSLISEDVPATYDGNGDLLTEDVPALYQYNSTVTQAELVTHQPTALI